jgi:hypothetical protein
MRKPGSRLAYTRREQLAAVHESQQWLWWGDAHLLEPALCEFADIGICAEC